MEVVLHQGVDRVAAQGNARSGRVISIVPEDVDANSVLRVIAHGRFVGTLRERCLQTGSFGRAVGRDVQGALRAYVRKQVARAENRQSNMQANVVVRVGAVRFAVKSNAMVLPPLLCCGSGGLPMRASFFFGAMVWTGFQLPAFLRLPFGVRSTTCDSQELSGAPLR